MNEEMQMEVVEIPVEVEEIPTDVEMDNQDNSASLVESTEVIPSDSESAAELSEDENAMLAEIIELLSDPEEADAPDGSESESIIEVDYTETLVLIHDELVHLNQCLDIVVMVLLAWFGSWVFRSWRTWMVKGGK